MGSLQNPRIRWGTLEEYQELWRSARVRCPYATPGWLQALAHTYGFPLRFALWDQGAVPFVVVPGRWGRGPRRWVSLPFSDRSGVIRPHTTGPLHLLPEEFQALKHALQRQGLVWELRNLALPDPAETPPTYENFTLLLDPSVPPEKGFKSTIKRNVKKARKSGVEIHRFRHLEALWVFYRLFAQTHQRHGVPVQPWRWFVNLWRFVVLPGEGFLSLALYQGRAIAGALFLQDGETVVYKYGATDYRYQRLRPNDLLFHEEILRAWHRGYRFFDLGRVGPNEEGLREYKKKWGAKALPLYYHSSREGWQTPAETSRLYAWATGWLQRAPVGTLRWLGDTLYAYFA